MLLAAPPASVRAAPVSFTKPHSFAFACSIAPCSQKRSAPGVSPKTHTPHSRSRYGDTPVKISTCSLGSIARAQRLISFRPCSIHPLPSFLMLAGCPTKAAFSLRLLLAHSCLIRKASLSFTCIVRPLRTPAAKYTAGPPMEPVITLVPRAPCPAPCWGLAVSVRSSFLLTPSAVLPARRKKHGFYHQ